MPSPPKGRRWLKSTREVWEDWHTSGLADDWTAPQLAHAKSLLALHDDLARATSPTARLRLSNEVRQLERVLHRKQPRRKVKWVRRGESLSPQAERPPMTAEQELAPLWE